MFKPKQDQSMQVNYDPSHVQGEELIGACMDGDMKKVTTFLAKNADINYISPSFGDTPLSQAAFKGHQNVVTHLLETNKIDQYSKDLALILAAQAGRTTIMKILVRHGADVNADVPGKHQPALFQTIIHNQQSAFEYLIGCNNINLALTATRMNNAYVTDCAVFYERQKMLEILTELEAPTAGDHPWPRSADIYAYVNERGDLKGKTKKPGYVLESRRKHTPPVGIHPLWISKEETHQWIRMSMFENVLNARKAEKAQAEKAGEAEHTESKSDINGGPTTAR